MSNYLLLLLLFPLIWPFLAKYIFGREITWVEVGINIALCVMLVIAVWYTGTHSKVTDFEIWNGKVVSKDRDHDSYLRSYDCRCSTDSNGHRSCDTCYETHYTVTWTANTTVGQITFDHLDSTSSLVYLSPDPTAYVKCKIGEPASLEHSFVNYVKAVPETLFNRQSSYSSIKTQVPAYPRVHSFYKIDRVLSVGTNIPTGYKDRLNKSLNEALVNLGASKQVNLVVIFTGEADPSYRGKVEASWIGGKKNDLVLFVGINSNSEILWADAMTFGLNKDNELARVKIGDSIKAIGKLPLPEKFSSDIVEIVKSSGFRRTNMQNFEYLKDQVTPPTWAIVLSIIIAFGGSITLSWFLARNSTREYR